MTVWEAFRKRPPRLAPLHEGKIVLHRSEAKGMAVVRGTALQALPLGRIVQTPTEKYNGVPHILCTKHDPSLGTEMSGSDIARRKGKEAKSVPHTHQHSTRAQAAKQGGKTLAAIVEYTPDPADPYTPCIDWAKSSGKQAGREFFSAKARRPTLLARLARTLEAVGVNSSVPAAGEDLMLSDDEGTITGKEEAVEKPRKRHPRMPPGAYQCFFCKAQCEDHKDFQQHVFTQHRELCQRPADMETTDNGTG